MNGSGRWNIASLKHEQPREAGLLKKSSKIANWAATAVVSLALIGIIAFFMGPRLLGWQLIVVLSGSMEPTLPVGSVVFMEPQDASAVKVGDMITFRLPQEVGRPADGKVVQVTHRVVEVVGKGQNLGFRTKGDANNGPDGFVVPAANVVGLVRGDIPYLGYAADRLRTKQGFMLLVGVPGALIIVGELRKIIREIKGLRSKSKLRQEA